MKTAPLAKLSGQGDYLQTMRSIGKALKPLGQALKPVAKRALVDAGGIAGNFLGSKVGLGSQGATAGKQLASKLSRLIGTGDYSVLPATANSLLPSPGQKSAYASFQDQTFGTRVSHREYVQDILTGPTAGVFNINTFPINPSLFTSFPYLAPIAQNFEEYVVKGLVYEFISTTSPYNANSAIGSVIMTCEYNAALPAFTSKAAMENSEFALSGRFDQSLMYGVECAENSQNAYYCRGQPGMAPLPVTTTDLGDFYIATAPASTFPANSIIGELWVSYDIEFRRPRISAIRGGYYRFSSQGQSVATVGNYTVTPVYPSGLVTTNTPTVIQNGSLQAITFLPLGSSVISLASMPIGSNLLCTFVASWALTTATGSLSVLGNTTATSCNFDLVYQGGVNPVAQAPSVGQTYVFSVATTQTVQIIQQVIVTTTAQNATVTPPNWRLNLTGGSFVGSFDVLISDVGMNYSP